MRWLAILLLLAAGPAAAQQWVTAWAASVQGPYPVGNPSAQPDLQFALPGDHARDQTFRLIVKPDIWGRQTRLRFSNAYGTKPLVLDGVFVGLQTGAATVLGYSTRPVLFGGKKSVTIAPGSQAWSDSTTLSYVSNPDAPELVGRKLAVSFHVVDETGPLTWHAKAMQTSYITPPGAGALGEIEDDSAFPNSTTSWFFLDALDMATDGQRKLVVCFGDSITDGTASTLNGDDRWPDVLARRLRASRGRFSVVNAGIGGNQVVGPASYGPEKPFAGGPSALSRLERDVAGLSGVTHVIWLEGINDFGDAGKATFEQVQDGMKKGVAVLRAKIPGVKVLGATLTSVAGTASAAHKGPEVEERRKALNGFIRDSKGVFDGVVDLDAATVDPASGAMRAELIPSSTIGGPGDGLHPNRAGYLAMGNAIDLRLLTGGARPPRAAPPKPAPAPAPE